MRSKEETTAIVNTAITDLRTAMIHKDIRNIIQAMSNVENDPAIDLDIIDDELFKQWNTITTIANHLIQ